MRTGFRWMMLGVGLSTSLGVAASCDYSERHPISATFAADIERSGGVTFDMREAQTSAYAAWNAELNRLYGALMQRMKREDDRTALRKAQRAWLAFHQAESDWLWSRAMHADEGTAGPLNVAGAGLVRIEQRVCDLHGALEWLDLSPGMNTD
jgi:uncharacterized protein YecT (DUF1311 family)